jgi:hypothetical protein
MSRASPGVGGDLTTAVDARLDEIAAQVRGLATVLRDALDMVVEGELDVSALAEYRATAETLIAAWDLEREILRRRPR